VRLELYLSGCRLQDGEYLILVSSEFCEKPHEQYKKRWGIESLFEALKSRGFNLEDTRLKDSERLSRLLALLALAFTWGLCCWPLASECQRAETQETR
jgi:DDE family transposase